jgi:Angiotensin-converting enzyme
MITRSIITTMPLLPCSSFNHPTTSRARFFINRPQSCNYADDKEVGGWLNDVLKKGGTEDWREVLKEATGEDISIRAMIDYFKPLMSWLEEQNKGRQIGWE